MDTHPTTCSIIMLLLTFTTVFHHSPVAADEPQTYIVRVSSPRGQTFENLEGWYNTFLPKTPMNSGKKPQIIYAYRNIFKGFAAKLTIDQAKSMENRDGFVSAQPEKVLSLHTTHTPKFLGLQKDLGFWRDSNYGKGVIIGVLDTGITPAHPSFSDAGISPPPAKWKGKCETKGCNNKLIGLRNFVGSSRGSPLDQHGHGTHTAGTAAGNFVDGANVFGNANGTAVGTAPLAHLAIYKVCSNVGCSEADLLAAMDAAIEENVDVLSLSIGGPSLPLYNDLIAIGAFVATQKGIFVSCSAGNSGPFRSSLSNEAPWVLTVGATTVDRRIRATVKLGNKVLLDGESLNQPEDFPKTLLPLVFPGMTGNRRAVWCGRGSLNNIDVKGKVVVCLNGGGVTRISKGQTVKNAGGAAMILTNIEAGGASTMLNAHVLPNSYVGYKDRLTIQEYINSTTSPMATILFQGTVIGVKTAPQVTYFSSRGPSQISSGILKPDVVGPGANILAAWHVPVDSQTTKSPFNMISGTSMSCPHLSGIAALLKSAHPDWSPAAIKSAIMTTADMVNLENHSIQDERELPASLFAVGAGHVNPTKANDPGLIYDIQPDDYIPYLCGLKYSNKQITSIVQKKVSCSDISSIPGAQLNYPSFVLTLGANDTSKTYTRTVTNVGEANSSYDVKVFTTPDVTVVVSPLTLTFVTVNQKLSYKVTFTASGSEPKTSYGEGSLVWNSMNHSVRSPFSIRFA